MIRFHRQWSIVHCVVVVLMVLGGCQSAPREQEASLYPNFGTYHREITTDNHAAQQWFDQGIQLLYGFNHDEAIRAFETAAEIDPNCAMAWWGVAYANGLHINNPEMTEQQSRNGYEAAQEALERIEHASPVEQTLIRAVALRYAWPIPEDRSPLDHAYADAMQKAWSDFPNDADVGALYAESLMNLQPWDLWTKDGKPKGRTEEIVAALEKVLAMKPNHPGANHFYIHTVEASQTPERALTAANRLENLVPGSGHLVHMPSHIYIRVGKYDDAADANTRAIQADKAYFAVAPEPEFYGLYIVHNYHFLAYAAMMEGRYETALRAARELESSIPRKFLEKYVFIADGFMYTSRHVMIRFGKWNEVLDQPAPPEFRRLSLAMHHYARGVAFAALGKTKEAREEQQLFEHVSRTVPADWMVGNNTASDVLAIARCMLEGEVLFREGDYDDAFAKLREGATLEDQLAYDEPPGWMQPVRHALGALLMDVGRAGEAEAVYREDLARNPNNGWGLLGLEMALRAQNEEADAQEIAQLVENRQKIWRRADVRPKSSCYCAPG